MPLADAIRSYLFNAQLVTPPDGQPTLIVPTEARRPLRSGGGSSGMSQATDRSGASRSWMSGNPWPMAAGRRACGCAWSPIRRPIDPRFLVDEAKLDRIADVIGRIWPEQIHSDELQNRCSASRNRGRAGGAARDLDLAQLI